MSYSHNWLKKKWLIARRKGKEPIRVTSQRFRTKKQAEKMARSLNKSYRGTKIKFLVRKVGWRKKRGYS